MEPVDEIDHTPKAHEEHRSYHHSNFQQQAFILALVGFGLFRGVEFFIDLEQVFIRLFNVRTHSPGLTVFGCVGGET